MPEIIFEQESYAIVGAAIHVHNELGCGFVESVYQEAFEIELKYRSIPYIREAPLRINYRGGPLKKGFNADFICYDKIIVELKAVRELDAINQSQAFNYLKASRLILGILINFGKPQLDTQRILKTY